MGEQTSEKSRKERRKETRLAKKKIKFNSWMQHQKSQNQKKTSLSINLGNKLELQRDAQNSRKSAAVVAKNDSQDEIKVEKPIMVEKPKVKSKVSKDKGLVKCSKNKFSEYLEMEMRGGRISVQEDLRLEKKLSKKLKVKNGQLRAADDDIDALLEGIPSVLDSLGDVEANIFERFRIGNLDKEGEKSDSLDERSEDEMGPDDYASNGSEDEMCTDEGSQDEMGVADADEDSENEVGVDVDKEFGSLDANGDGREEEVSISKKSNKGKRKTKFEEYLETEMQGGNISGDMDLALEKRLAKRLKVKEGKLGGDEDDINMLLEGIPSALDFSDEEAKHFEDAFPESVDNSTSPRNRKRTKSAGKNQEAEDMVHTTVVVSEQLKCSKPIESDKALKMTLVTEGNAKYVPRFRSREQSVSENAQFHFRIRGLLNRLGISNVESITGEISNLFHSVGRSFGSQIINEQLLGECAGGPRKDEQEEYLEDVNLSLHNLTLLLSNLYIFGVCSSELMYDFLTTVSKRFSEVDVSTVLTVMQSCGMKLRADDPVGMKNFILCVQNRVNELKASSINGQSSIGSTRMDFMLETICDIKNNKKRPREEAVHHSRIKKWLQKLRVDDILLRGLNWSKLLNPNKKGQWWLSGDTASTSENIEEVANKIDREIPETQKMLQLAAAQRMNTDARRAIFCIIMSAEDYVDALEKLLRLDLPGKQDREIMRVLVECCLQEKVFNKYYCVLASKLCSHDKNHKFTLQYCLWDHFKELETMPLIRSMHLAKFVAEMVASYNLSLAVLKVFEFNDTTQLTPKRVMHFRMLFETLLELSDKLIWNIFTRIAVTPEYELLRSGIEFFINKYVVNGQKSLASKFKIAKKALNNVEGVLM